MAVLKPLKVIIENYPESQTEELEAKNNPNDEEAGTRKIQFTRELFIEQDDFMEDPPKKFFRLAPGREVRLRYAFFITCKNVIKNEKDEILEIHCTYDPETKGGNAPDGRKVKGTIHWVAAPHAVDAEIRKYEHLFTKEIPGKDGEFLDDINPDSLQVLSNCKLEPALQNAPIGETIQFERLGYYCADKDTSPSHLIFNETIGLRDTWEKKNQGRIKMPKKIEHLQWPDAPKMWMPYAPAIKVTGGSTIYCAGVTAAPVYHHHPHRPEEFDNMPKTMDGQARAVMENLRQGLEAAGATFSDVIVCDRFLTDMEQQDDLNKVWNEYFTEHSPASTTVQIVRLATDPRCLLEVNAIAVID